MPEILTESFCERCGTRYTFQSAAPKVGRMAKMKVLSRGLKNYVLSDETSLDEALADARGLDDREHSVEQLDAFHKTFNFCMSCRQYTCANCWNDREGRCLSCAPSLSVGILPTSPLALNPVSGIAGIGGNGSGAPGNGHIEGVPMDSAAWPTTDLGIAPDEGAPFAGTAAIDEKPVSRLEALFGREAAARIEAGAPKSDAGESEITSVPEMIGLEKEASAEPAYEAAGVDVEASEAPAVEPVLTIVADAPDAQDAANDAEDADAVEAGEEPAAAAAIAAQEDETEQAEEAIAAAAELPAAQIVVHAVDPETDDLAATAAAQTHGLLDKFRAKPVAIPAPRSVLPTPVSPRLPSPYLTPPGAANGPAAPQMPYAAVGPPTTPAMPQPYGARAAMPYAAQAAQPYAAPNAPIQPYPAPASSHPSPAPAVYPPFQPEYVGLPPQPQYAAPALPPQYAPPPPQPGYPVPQPPPGYPVPQPQYSQPAPQSPAPSWRMVAPESTFLAPGNGNVYGAPPASAAEPQWPTTPSWPAPLARGAEAVWAESTRDLLSRPEAGVSACFNCGLPLSATARFCRRCGTSQISS